MRINHNITALNAHRQLTINNAKMGKNLNRLSSGLRINSAADDAAGLSISEKMRAQIRGLDQAVSNAQDGISMVQTAEGALTEIHSILQRERELAVKGGSSILSTGDLAAINEEITQLNSELDRISSTTEFNGQSLLDGAFTASIMVGASGTIDDTITIALTAVDSTTLAVVAVAADGTQAQSEIDITAIDAAIATVSASRSAMGASQNRLDHAINNLSASSENLTASESRIRDVDMAKEMIEFTKNSVLAQAAQSMLAQANAQPQSILQLLQ